MFMICDEMWNSVHIYGPQSEIDRFKDLCIVPAPEGNSENSTLAIDFDRIPDCYGETWNFRETGNRKRGFYSFAFDTASSFPIPVFERLANMFPTLAFDCECIADDDRSMGFGWFNTPPGGEDFFDRYDVPEGYWEVGGPKRTPAAHKRHEALIAALIRTLQEVKPDRRSTISNRAQVSALGFAGNTSASIGGNQRDGRAQAYPPFRPKKR